MSAPDQGPLAALLASHPEECAAVLCALMVAGVTKDGRTLANVAALCRMRLDPDDAQRILDAMVAAGIVYRTCLPGAVWVLVIKGAEPERAAIARMGAAAWLSARLSVGDGLPAEIDVDGMVDARGIQFIGKAVRGADGAYLCLANVGGALCRVEVKVTRDRETGAGAPAKGEQR